MPSAASIANLHPAWKRGQSGFRAGATRAYRRVLKVARAASPKAMETISACMRDKEAPWPAGLLDARVVLERAHHAADQRGLLDEQRTTSVNINIVDLDPDGIESNCNIDQSDHPPHRETVEAPLPALRHVTPPSHRPLQRSAAPTAVPLPVQRQVVLIVRDKVSSFRACAAAGFRSRPTALPDREPWRMRRSRRSFPVSVCR
jgi:hypothetical protein